MLWISAVCVLYVLGVESTLHEDISTEPSSLTFADKESSSSMRSSIMGRRRDWHLQQRDGLYCTDYAPKCVIANGTGPVECFNVSKFGFNISLVWSLVDTAQPFSVLAAVRRFEMRNDIDAILVFDWDERYHQATGILSGRRNKQLITFDNFKLSDQNEEQESYSSEDTICRATYGSKGPYCEIDANRASESITSRAMALSIGTKALSQLIVGNLNWKRVFVIHDNTTERETMDLVDALSLEGVMVVIYNIDTTSDFNATLAQIYHSTVRMKPEMNFVVMCRSQCVRNILQKANNFDAHKTIHTTMLKQFSRWLVAEVGHTIGTSQAKCTHSHDLDNVVILAIPDIIAPSSQDLAVILDAVVTDLYSRSVTNLTSEDITTKVDIIDLFKQKAKTWYPSARCKAFKIDTLLWTNNGREFLTVGSVDVHGQLNLQSSELFPNLKYGYNKRQFIVSTLPYDPFVIKRTEEVKDKATGEPTGNVTVHYEGLTMDLLKELSRVLNFTFVIIEPDDQKWGGLEIEENYTFNGLIGQLQRMECDFVAAPISIQANREVVVDFSYPYFYDYTTVVVKKPDPQTVKWRTLIDPFKWEVLLSIGVGLGIVTVLMYLLEKYNPYYDTPEHGAERTTLGGLHYLHNSFWYMYGCLLNQGGVHLPGSTAGRTFVSCWWLTCIVVVGIYCGNLIAFLTVTKEKPPFNTLEEMVDMDDYVYGTLGATHWEVILMTSGLPIFKKIGDEIREVNRSDPGVLDMNLMYHLNRVKQGGYAWIGDKTTIEIYMATECDLISIKEEFMPMKYAIAFPENSPHQLIFSERIMALHESGLLQIWKMKWWPKSNFCALGKAPEATPISLIDVQSAFYVCVLGTCVGIIAFVAEHVVFRLRRRRTQNCDNTSGHKVHEAIGDPVATNSAESN